MINRTQEEIMRNWVGNINNPLVSIRCIAYNHEKYISDALDSFLMQETSFPFEIIVHDDASTDNTANIIKKYEKKFPLIIKPIYEKENQYSKQDGSLSRIINSKIKGKYLAFCEGDDYWVDKNKLQIQTNSLEENTSCFLCVTKVKVINVKTSAVYYLPYLDFDAGVINSHTFVNSLDIYNFHTSSYFVNTQKYFEYHNLDLDFKKKAPVGDTPILLYFGNIGNVFYINKTMSIYRKETTGSWSNLIKKNRNKYIEILQDNIEMIKAYNEYTNNKYSDMCVRCINGWQFYIYLKQKQYKNLLDRKYATILSMCSIENKILIFFGAIFQSFYCFFGDLVATINNK